MTAEDPRALGRVGGWAKIPGMREEKGLETLKGTRQRTSGQSLCPKGGRES